MVLPLYKANSARLLTCQTKVSFDHERHPSMAALVAAPPNGDVNSTNFFLTVALAAR